MIWLVSCTMLWNPPTYRCGSANATEAGFIDFRLAGGSHPGPFGQIFARRTGILKSSSGPPRRTAASSSAGQARRVEEDRQGRGGAEDHHVDVHVVSNR